MKKTSGTSPRKPAEQALKPVVSTTVKGGSAQKADDAKTTTKTVAVKPVETKPVANKPAEVKTAAKSEAKAGVNEGSPTKTVEAQPDEPKKAAIKTVEPKPVETQPVAEARPIAQTHAVAQKAESGKDMKKPLSANDGEFISDYDIYLFREGRHRRIYEKLGAHVIERGGKKGTHFGVWAPNASSISVVGDFNQWDGRTNPLKPIAESGIWGGFIEGVDYGALYKYELHDHNGHLLPLKSDPYAFGGEMRPQTASIVTPFPKVERSKIAQTHRDPISIYEVHLGSWRRGDGDRFLTYNELADQLIPYAKDMGFTHIELLPITEHPFDGSWGYQPVGLFAPTSRFGTAEEFATFVRRAHEAGIGILLDWVPGHFPNDPHGLAFFDGTHLYDHQDPREGMHEDWGTMIYNFGRTEVANFLLSNAQFWLDRFGLDGLRVDAVASMIYRNYSRKPGQWVPNKYGEVENLEATAFLREMNSSVFGEFPQATTIAEESTAWPGVSRPVHFGGLGFGFKWNMGWMHDTLNYMAEDPVHRKYHHHNMTFGLLYGFTENFVLPLSHDEVVHGKHSLLGRMPGDEWQRFANLRAYYGFMYGHPGKKLLFMGSEIAPYGEWNHDHSLDWHLLQYPVHSGIQALVRDLNHLYKSTPSLYSYDCEQRGFEWIESHAAEASVLAFLRRGDEGDPITVVVSNFTPVPRNDYRIGVPHAGFYEERLNTDSAHYGGTNVGNDGGRHSDDIPWDGRPYSISLNLPPLATVFLVLKGNK